MYSTFSAILCPKARAHTASKMKYTYTTHTHTSTSKRNKGNANCLHLIQTIQKYTKSNFFRDFRLLFLYFSNYLYPSAT